MTEQSIAEAIAATLIILCLVGGAVAAAAIMGANALEWIEQALRNRGATMLAEIEHHYHDTIRPKQEADHSEWLAKAQDAITRLSQDRPDGIVSADDVWDICPPPDDVDPRVMGAIWQPRDRWQIVGYEPSRRPINHKRRIAQWKFLTLEEMREAAE